MKVGDLIRDKEYTEDIGIVIKINRRNYKNYCKVFSVCGNLCWLSRDYIEDNTELIPKPDKNCPRQN